jgi:dTDP-4-dehydrorhamnose reductase
MKFIITGAKGQLAKEFLNQISDIEVKALDKESLDISDLSVAEEAVSHFKPDVIINCAAYNFVDEAEGNFDVAYRVNALGPKNLALTCKKYNTLLVHYSTDYVFDGGKGDFYTEQDEPKPKNNYGKSKLDGERLLQEETDNFLLFRVSWVFGQGKQNFFCKLKQWTETQNVVKVACDQISVPTYTEDIVKVTIRAINKGVRGVFHLTNSGYASRYETARYFVERLGLSNLILPVGSNYFPSPAKRPYFSAMSNAKISKILNISIPDWKDGVDRFIKRGIA